MTRTRGWRLLLLHLDIHHGGPRHWWNLTDSHRAYGRSPFGGRPNRALPFVAVAVDDKRGRHNG